jgi:DNA-binding transcriptional LysR family regulator
MHRYQNIPIDLLRAAVHISETGSLSKAADRLGLSQPAITSQVKRLQRMVGGCLFERTSNGTHITGLGKLVLQQAKKMLDANDQILMFGGAEAAPQQLRLGLSTLFARDFYASTGADIVSNLVVQFDKSGPIFKGLLEGYFDVACVYERQDFAAEIERFVVNETVEPLVWVRSKNFALRHGAPLPVIAWSGDDWMLRTLDRHGVAYRIMTNSPDYHAKVIAIEAGIGLSAFPERHVPESLVVAKDNYLPQLPPIKSLLCIKNNAESTSAHTLLKHLSKLFFANSAKTNTATVPAPAT